MEIPGTDRERWIMPKQNDIRVDLHADHRKKGLVWYSTYIAGFEGVYTLANSESVVQKVRLHFDFPAQDGTYDDFSAAINGASISQDVNTREGIHEIVEVPPGKEMQFRVTYRTRGLSTWRYAMDPNAGPRAGTQSGSPHGFR